MASAAEVSGLQLCVLNALDQIDAALDRGDRRLFKQWCRRHRDLQGKISRLLLAIATAESG